MLLFVRLSFAMGWALGAVACNHEAVTDVEEITATSFVVEGVHVQVEGPRGIDATAERLTVSDNATRLLFEGKVSLTLHTPPAIRLDSETLHLNLNTQTIRLEGNVTSRIPLSLPETVR
jgi:hypothetical protein